MIWLLILPIVLGIRIKFDPSQKLTELSSKSDLSFFYIIRKSILSEQYWPILSAFHQARFYNFVPVFLTVLKDLECKKVLEIIQTDGFPVHNLITNDLLMSGKLSICFSHLPIRFLNTHKINPMKYKRYTPSEWRIHQHFEFISAAFQRPSIKTNWFNWCHDPNLTESTIFGTYTEAWNSWIWKTISFHCISALQEPIATRIQNIVTPEAELIQFYNGDNNSITSRLSELFGGGTSAEIVNFSIIQIMKIITLSTYILACPSNHELHTNAAFSLNNYLMILKRNKKKFPFRHELKSFIRNLLADPRERDPISTIQQELLSMTQFCKGHVIGPWLLNVLVLWNYFNGDVFIIPSQFLDPFFEIYFAPESLVTASDTCLMLRFVNSAISGPDDDYYITERIIDNHFMKRVSLAREVLLECAFEIPKNKKTDSLLFPIDFRLECMFKSTRFIDTFTSSTFSFVKLNRSYEKICLTTIHEISTLLDHKHRDNIALIPLNSRIFVGGVNFKENLPGLLKIFFKSLMFSIKWFTIIENSHSKIDSKPIILPTLFFPPQFMEAIGFLLGQAVISNVKIPFFIDKRYFHLHDQLLSTEESSKSISDILRELYPEIDDPKCSSDTQIRQVVRSLDYSSKRVLKFMDINQKLFEDPVSPGTFEVSFFDMSRIFLMGSERLRMGLESALPVDFFNSNQLYYLIFR